MKKFMNGQYVEVTAEEIAEAKAEAEKREAEYWRTVSYDEAVNAKIRERYTASAEFAILRQRDEKPDEYKKYFAYCEECKAFVKAKKAQYTETDEPVEKMEV
jgi:hypothetical protein